MMNTRIRTTLTLMTALAVTGLFALLFLSCGAQTLNPKFQPEISNVTDNFQFQVTNVRNYTNAYQYSWTNTGTVATVNQASAVTGGTAVLTIRDNAGTQVYSQSVAQNGTFDTAAGIAGTWTIVLNLTKTSGTINFRVQKKI